MTDGVEFEAFAEMLRRGGEVPAMVDRLAQRLDRALPGHVRAGRSGLLGGRRLRSLVVEFAAEHFRIELGAHGVHAWVDHVVRGVCVRSDEVSVDDWLDGLALALSAEAKRSTELGLALREALQ